MKTLINRKLETFKEKNRKEMEHLDKLEKKQRNTYEATLQGRKGSEKYLRSH